MFVFVGKSSSISNEEPMMALPILKQMFAFYSIPLGLISGESAFSIKGMKNDFSLRHLNGTDDVFYHFCVLVCWFACLFIIIRNNIT